MRKGIAKTCISSIMAAALLLAGCGPSRQTSEVHSRPAPQSQAPQSQPREFRHTRPASVVFVEYVVTPHDVVARMLELARVQSDDVVYDLGCGDGRILIAAAKKYGCRAVGFDLDHMRVEEAQANVEKSHLADQVTVELKDVLNVDLRGATVVAIYLGTELNRKLVPQLQQLRPGARIVSHNFGIEGFVPDDVIRMTSGEDHEDHLIYLWTSPLQRSPQP